MAPAVVKRCAQKKGIDVSEIFSPLVKMSSTRVRLVASLDHKFEQLDVRTAFLHETCSRKSTCINLRVLELTGRSTWFVG